MRALACVLVAATAACAGTRPPAPTIAWRTWGPDVFAEARRHARLVLVDVGIEGCTACRWMAERTYRDPAVVQRIATGFVAVQVDAHARPDLGARYETVGWPATVFFTPDGREVLAVRGNKLPVSFVPILDVSAFGLGPGPGPDAAYGC